MAGSYKKTDAPKARDALRVTQPKEPPAMELAEQECERLRQFEDRFRAAIYADDADAIARTKAALDTMLKNANVPYTVRTPYILHVQEHALEHQRPWNSVTVNGLTKPLSVTECNAIVNQSLLAGMPTLKDYLWASGTLRQTVANYKEQSKRADPEKCEQLKGAIVHDLLKAGAGRHESRVLLHQVVLEAAKNEAAQLAK